MASETTPCPLPAPTYHPGGLDLTRTRGCGAAEFNAWLNNFVTYAGASLAELGM